MKTASAGDGVPGPGAVSSRVGRLAGRVTVGGAIATAIGCHLIGWPLGLDLVLPGVVLIAAAVALLATRRLLVRPPAVWLSALWLLAWISFLRTDLSLYRWLVFLHGQFALLAGIAAFSLLASARRTADLRLGLKAVALLGVIVAIGALAASQGLLPLKFSLPLGLPMPSGDLAESAALSKRLLIRVTASKWPSYIRPSIFFLYANFLAAAMVGVGFVCLSASQFLERKGWRVVSWLGVGAGLLIALLTRGRAAILAMGGGLIVWLVCRPIVRRWGLRGMRYALLFGLLAATILVTMPLRGGSLLDRALVGMRVGSFIDRTAVYGATLQATLHRPWLGFGTRQTAPEAHGSGLFLRLGSHSDPLNVAYRFGLTGLALYLAAGISVGVEWLRGFKNSLKAPFDQSRVMGLWLAVGVGLVATAFAASFIDLQLDVNAYWLCWLIAGLAYAPALGATAEVPERE